MNPDGASASEIEWLLAAVSETVEGSREVIEESREMVEQSRLMSENANRLTAETDTLVRRAREQTRALLCTIRPRPFPLAD